MEIECILSKSSDNTKLDGNVDLLRGRKALQTNMDRLSQCAKDSCTRFSKVKCLGCSNPVQCYRLMAGWLRS